MQQSLYDKYGGFARINRVVMSFYDALLDSEEVGPYFDGVDMVRLIDHQTKFISYLLGGPVEFSDDNLQRAHRNLSICDAHFDVMKAVLGNTLAGAGFDGVDVDSVLAQIEQRRGLIVSNDA